MTGSCDVGYGRPPEHTRFRKGQSGNPGGRPAPKLLLKVAFEAALGEALNADEQALREAKPTKVIEVLARQVALRSLDGRTSAQKLVLSILGCEGRRAADDEGEKESTAVLSSDERMRQVLGDRYDDYKRRFEAAVAAGSGDDLLAIAKEFESLDEFPQ
jgi:hypothetical protein